MIGILGERSQYSAFSALLAALCASDKPPRIDALVLNRRSDFWSPASEDERTDTIADETRAFRKWVLNEDFGLEIGDDATFVVSLLAWRVGAKMPWRSDVHDAQVAALRKRMWEQCARQGVEGIVSDGCGAAEVALTKAEQHLDGRRHLVETSTSGGASAADVSGAMRAATAVARTTWSTSAGPDTSRVLAVQEWARLAPAINAARDEVLVRITELIDGLAGRLGKSAAVAIQTEVDLALRHSTASIEAAQREILSDVAAGYLAVANGLLVEVYDAVPAVRPEQAAVPVLDVDDLLGTLQLGRFDEDRVGQVARWASAGVFGTLVGMITGGSGMGVLVGVGALALGPISALVVGAAGAGAVGWLIVGLFRGGYREAVRKRLEQARTGLRKLTTEPGGELFRTWEQLVGSVAGATGDLLERRLAALEETARDPKAGAATLAAEHASITAALAEMARLRAGLGEIDSRAASS